MRYLFVAAAVLFVAAVVYGIGWAHFRCPRWFLGCTCMDERAVERDREVRREITEEWDEWDRMNPDQAASTLIAEWHEDLPGPAPDDSRDGVGEYHERLAGRDVWDQWWQGLDGLDRECLLVTRWRHREEGLWAALVAETRELCAA